MVYRDYIILMSCGGCRHHLENNVKRPLRKCVVGVIGNEEGAYLVGERSGLDGCWQFPQGVIEEGETPKDALFREVKEEIGCGEIEILRESKTPIDYLFPLGLKSRITEKFSGQIQTWFLARLIPGAKPDLALSDGEFQKLEWMTLEDILAIVVDWKRPAYIDGLAQLAVWPKGES